jgi:hypothetical protein
MDQVEHREGKIVSIVVARRPKARPWRVKDWFKQCPARKSWLVDPGRFQPDLAKETLTRVKLHLPSLSLSAINRQE